MGFFKRCPWKRFPHPLQSSYKNFKCKFLIIQASTGDMTLLDGFPLFWTPEPRFRSTRRLKDFSPKDQGIYEFLMSLKIVFDTSYLSTKEYLLGALKTYIGTPHLLPFLKITLLLSLTIYLLSLHRECCLTIARRS